MENHVGLLIISLTFLVVVTRIMTVLMDGLSRREFLKVQLEGGTDYKSILEVPSTSETMETYIKTQERQRRWMIPASNLKPIKFLGEGSFGAVHLNDFCGTKVAVKVSKKLTTREYEAMVRESLLHIEIRHPCICQLLGLSLTSVHNSSNSGPQLQASSVLEYMPGGNLDSIVYDANQSFSLPFLLKALQNVAEGMAHLHHNQPQIVHADLKSENIFVDKVVGCKVGDLGGSVLLDGIDTHHAAPLSLIYASPNRLSAWGKELVKPSFKETSGNQSQGARLQLADDVYAFGIMVFELLTRQEAWGSVPEDDALVQGVINGTLFLVNELPQRDASFLTGKFYPAPDPSAMLQCGSALIELMNDCTLYNAKDRPTFKDVIKRVATISEGFHSTEQGSKTRASPRNNKAQTGRRTTNAQAGSSAPGTTGGPIAM